MLTRAFFILKMYMIHLFCSWGMPQTQMITGLESWHFYRTLDVSLIECEVNNTPLMKEAMNMLTILCILAFPFVVLAELMKMNK